MRRILAATHNSCNMCSSILFSLTSLTNNDKQPEQEVLQITTYRFCQQITQQSKHIQDLPAELFFNFKEDLYNGDCVEVNVASTQTDESGHSIYWRYSMFSRQRPWRLLSSCDTAPCSQADTDRSFGGAYCSHHQGDKWRILATTLNGNHIRYFINA